METLLEKVIGLDYTLTGSGNKWRKTEEHTSLVLNLEEQRWFWNSKDLNGTPLEYLILIKGMPEKQAKALLKDLSTLDGGNLLFPKKDEIVIQNEKLVDVFWKNGLKDRDYWYRRGLTDKTINTFKLGKYDGFWTLPIYVDGKFMNFQCRTDVPEKKIRPWYRGVGPLLFNSSILPFVTKVYITEGPVDALLLNQEGIPTVSHTAGSSGWDNNWFSYFKRQKEIVYIADNDLAGYSAAKKVAKSLGEFRVKILSFIDYPLKYDAVDFFCHGGSMDEFKELDAKAIQGFRVKELYDRLCQKYPKETL